MHRRLVAYNLMDGGEGRADPIAEVLMARSPDVVGLHEATDSGVLRRLAARMAMDFVVAASGRGRVAILSRHRILDVVNLAAIYDCEMPILDATLDVDGAEMLVRVAHLTRRDEAERMAVILADRYPHAMLMSYDPPMGMRVVDGKVGPAAEALPERVEAPIRQLDQVLVARDVQVVETWAEHDRLAYYASDHLPGGAAIEWPPAEEPA